MPMVGPWLALTSLPAGALAWLLLVRSRRLDLAPGSRLAIGLVPVGLAVTGIVLGPWTAIALGLVGTLLAAPPLISAIWHLSERRRPPFAVEVVRLRAADGTAISAYRHAGGKPDALVIAHSLGGSSHRASLLNLADRCRTLADPILLDLRGHGGSGGAIDGREWMDVAAAAELARSLGYQRVHLAGLSIGAMASSRYVSEGGDAASLTLISPPGTRGRLEQIIAFYDTWVGRLVTRLQGGVIAPSAPSSVGDLRPAEETVAACGGRPVLLIGCADDFLFDGDDLGSVYAAASPPKRLVMIEGWRHGPFIVDRHPGLVIREVRRVLRRGGAGGEQADSDS
jgi:pimeloyl-ACP methyl ester carboxylesterase